MRTRCLAITVLTILASLLFALEPWSPAVAYRPNCDEPPFLVPAVGSNVLIILDNSGSMNEFAYKDATGSFTRSDSSDVSVSAYAPTGSGTCYQTMPCTDRSKSGACSQDNQCSAPDEASWTGTGAFTSCTGRCFFSYECYWSSNKCKRRYLSTQNPYCVQDAGNCTMTYSCSSYSTNSYCTVTVKAPNSEDDTAAAGYQKGTKYYGLFDPDKTYRYDNVKHYFKPVGTVVDPGNIKDASNNPVTIRAAAVGTNITESFSGNWLNWLTARRVDVAKKVLTGGRLGGDESEYVIVGSPMDRDYWKVFNDNGGTDNTKVYYTPFRQPFGVFFYTSRDLVQRTGDNGKFVPLFVFFKATSYNDATNRAQAPSGPYVSLTSTSNPGEPAYIGGVEKREHDNSYYFACKTGTVADDDAPAGIVQNMASKVRIGLMQYNFGQGPDQGNRLGAIYDKRDIDGDGTGPYPDGSGNYYDLLIRYANGGRVLNPCGDTSTVDSWQKKDNAPIQIRSIVRNINQTLWEGYTPLSSVLKEAMNYFKQTTPCYAWVDQMGNLQQPYQISDDWDPYYYKSDSGGGVKKECARSYVILVSDGEETVTDANRCSCKTLNCSTYYSNDPSRTFRFNGSAYLDDVAFQMYTEDMRTDLPGTQTISTYTVFMFDPAGSSLDLMQRAALAGGFVDLNSDGQPGKPIPSGKSSSSSWLSTYDWSNYDGYYEWDSDKDRNPDHFFYAQDGYKLETAIQSIFSQVALSGAAGAVATISQDTKQADIIVRGAFDGTDPNNRTHYLWNGHLEVYWPDNLGKYEFEWSPNTGLFCKDIVEGHCDGSKCCWDAGDIMQRFATTATVPRIFSYIYGRQFDLTVDNAILFATPMRQPEDRAAGIIQWARGKVDTSGYPLLDSNSRIPSGCSGSACEGPYRYRNGAKLGDIVYSTPVVVGPPPLGGVSSQDPDVSSFYDYRNANLTRDRVAYVGANDGMIHAYLLARWETTTDPATGKTSSGWNYQNADCGKEIWSYVPSNLLSELYDLANLDYGWMEGTKCRHRSMVDLSPKAWDVYIKSSSCTTTTCCPTKRCWRTVIIGGERGGGDMYFAIDVTDPYNPQVIWEHSVLQNLAVVYNEGSTQKMALPFREHYPCTDPFDPACQEDVYYNIKTMPMTWSEPVIGRVRFPAPDEDTGGGTYVSFWRYYKNYAGVPVLGQRSYGAGTCNQSGTKYNCSDNKREIAFIGGGFRNYDPSNLGATPQPNNDTVVKALTKPYLLALDMETGENLFQVAWPLLVKARTDAGKLYDLPMPSTSTSHFVPWSLGDVSVLDLWDSNDGADDIGKFAEDGFVDRIYVGDLHGFFYRMTFNFKSFLTSANNPSFWGLDINSWPAKPLCSPPNDRNCADLRNNYRGCRQPIIYAPSIALDSTSVSTDTPALRVLFGTGKLDDAPSDNLDQAKMSFYNLKDRVKLYSTTVSGVTALTALPNIAPTGTYTVTPATTAGQPDTVTSSGSNLSNGFTITGTRFGITQQDGACYSETSGSNQLMWAGLACTEGRGNDCCNWATSADQPDCCQQGSTTASPAPARTCPNCTSSPTSCPQIDSTSGLYSPCWSCIFDFAYPGERIVGKSVISGGYVFFTTYTPPDPGGCGTGGTGRLYILDYRCKTFPDNFNPLLGTSGLTVTNLMTNESVAHQYGVVVDLGSGMPSRPVLDSKGQSVLIQKSDGTFIRFPAPKFLIQPIQFKGGWSEK